MEVFLIRHGVAYERSHKRWPNDALRPLTPSGRRKFRKAARGLAGCLPKSVVLLTSPYVRARDTATILAKAGLRGQPIECAELAAGVPASKAFELLRIRKEKSIALVGHEPNLSSFLSAALAAERARLEIDFKKGGAACIEFAGRVEPGSGLLKWMLPPRVLRSLK